MDDADPLSNEALELACRIDLASRGEQFRERPGFQRPAQLFEELTRRMRASQTLATGARCARVRCTVRERTRAKMRFHYRVVVTQSRAGRP